MKGNAPRSVCKTYIHHLTPPRDAFILPPRILAEAKVMANSDLHDLSQIRELEYLISDIIGGLAPLPERQKRIETAS